MTLKPPKLAWKDAGLSATKAVARNALSGERDLLSGRAIGLFGAPTQEPVPLVKPRVLPHHFAGAGVEESAGHDEPENRRGGQQSAQRIERRLEQRVMQEPIGYGEEQRRRDYLPGRSPDLGQGSPGRGGGKSEQHDRQPEKRERFGTEHPAQWPPSR